MSNFKKMRLVEDNQPNNRDLFSQFTTSPTVQRLSELDIEIRDILNREINEREKAKLYSQTLRKFLTYKRIHKEQQILDQTKNLDLLKNIAAQINPKKKIKRKGLKIPKTPKKTRKHTFTVLRKKRNKRLNKNTNQPSTSKNVFGWNLNESDSDQSGADEVEEFFHNALSYPKNWQKYGNKK